jgi:hypothetical protein
VHPSRVRRRKSPARVGQALGIGDHVDFTDDPAGDREREHAARPLARGHEDAHRALVARTDAKIRI